VTRTSQELAHLQEELAIETRALAGSATEARPQNGDGAMTSALARGDAEAEVAEWLTDLGIEDGWDLAPALIEDGWSRPELEEVVSSVDASQRPHLARWLGLSAATEQVVGELAIGARRISELVRVVKEYSFLDRAPVQEIDPVVGIEDTLILLKHKLRDIDVTTDFADDLRRVEAAGRDLNQVWTNLIDNASDAMEGEGSLSIVARNDGDDVVITVADSGPGIPDDRVDRIFDPFFTTKEPGKGTGLGLHTVHTIVGRTGGSISVDSSPSGTTFEVRLPAVI
jgi:signal transduction histidine kinase